MKRDISAIVNQEYDLVIVGGGIFGVCAAWDAALRGLSVAIIEKGDFAHATSANHFKMVHGGIRYLQHADIYRVRESCRERSALLRIAPHLVQPLPIVIPTYGHGIKGREFLSVGLLLYDILTVDRNRGIQTDRRIPRGRFISRQEVLGLFPGIEEKSLTGGAVFCDGQIYNPPRLGLSFLRSAVDRGAKAANYVEATGFLRNGNRLMGVKAHDVLGNRNFDIHGRCVLNATGPWAHRLFESGLKLQLESRPTFSRDLAFVVNRPMHHGLGIAFSTRSKDTDTIMSRGGRHLFAVSWRDYMLVGVWHMVFDGPPEQITVSREEIRGFVEEVNAAFPGLNIAMDEITVINTGLTLFGEENRQGEKKMSFGKRSLLIDHGREHGLDGLVTLIGVRATTARGMAEKAVDIVMKKLGQNRRKSKTAFIPIYGGQIDSFNSFLKDAIRSCPPSISAACMTSLVRNYGSQYPAVLKYVDGNSQWGVNIGSSNTLKAEIIHAIREEMAQHLADVVYRRTDLGTGEIPRDSELQDCAVVMGNELKWESNRIKEEIRMAENVFQRVR